MKSDPNKRLAKELRGLGLNDMAVNAENGVYGDFTSLLATPKMVLVAGLADAAEKEARRADHRAAIMELRKRVMEGEFDG